MTDTLTPVQRRDASRRFLGAPRQYRNISRLPVPDPLHTRRRLRLFAPPPAPPSPQHGLRVCIWMHLVNGTGNSPSPGRPTPRVVKQDKSSVGSGDMTNTRSGPQRVRMSSGERPIGAAKGKQSDTEALCQPPPPPPASRPPPPALIPPLPSSPDAERRAERPPGAPALQQGLQGEGQDPERPLPVPQLGHDARIGYALPPTRISSQSLVHSVPPRPPKGLLLTTHIRVRPLLSGRWGVRAGS